MEIKPSFPKARRSSLTLEMRNNYYVVPFDGFFHYFPIKIDTEELNNPVKKFARLLKSPPVLIDGVVFSNRRAFEVSAEDILRGRVNKSREFKLERGEDEPTTTYPTSETETSDSGSSTVSSGRYQYETSGDVSMEIRKAADETWEEQVGALFSDIPSETGGEWIVEANPQP